MTDPNPAIVIPEAMSHGKRASLPALTSIRFFAAMYVVLFHCAIPHFIAMPAVFARVFDSGYTGVTLFFSLSGFILAYNYPRVSSPPDFWISRFARIYPVYALSLVVYLIIVVVNPTERHLPEVLPATWLSIVLLQGWRPVYATLLNPAAWTLSVEAFFYLVFPYVNPYCRKPSRVVVSLFFAIYLTLALSPILLAVYKQPSGLHLARTMDSTVPFFRLGSFLVGMLAGGRFLRGKHYRRLLTLSLLFTLVLLQWAPPDLDRPLKTMLLSYSYVGVIYGLARLRTGPLTNRWLLLGGEISYSIYLIQFIILRLGHGIMIRAFPSVRSDGLIFDFCFFIPVLLLVSYLSFRYLEVPARRAIRNLLSRPSLQINPLPNVS
jgi:peptidoglycan/LPS O-acetylase OafA/YrhL